MSDVGYGNRVRVYDAAETNAGNACGALHEVMAGNKTPMVFHMCNEKIVYVLNGKVNVIIIQGGTFKLRECNRGESIAIPAGVPHQFEALEDSLLVEFGTFRGAYSGGEDTTVIQKGTPLEEKTKEATEDTE